MSDSTAAEAPVPLVPPSLRFGAPPAPGQSPTTQKMASEQPRRQSTSEEQQQEQQFVPPMGSKNVSEQQPQDSTDEFAATTSDMDLHAPVMKNYKTVSEEPVQSPIDGLGGSTKAVPIRPPPPPSSGQTTTTTSGSSPYSASRRVDPTLAANVNDVTDDHHDDHNIDVTRTSNLRTSHRLKTSTEEQNQQSQQQQNQNQQDNNTATDDSSSSFDDEEDFNEELWIRRSWLRDFAIDNFACSLCRRLANDPVVLLEGDTDDNLVCRRCFSNELASTGAKMKEAPNFVTRAVQQLRTAFSTALTLDEAAEEERKRNEPRLDLNMALRIDEEEASRRSTISLNFDESFNELYRKHQIRLRSRMPGTSRQLKCEGDQKYEAQDYNGAYELYSRAIDVNDGTQKLAGMYANRSASLFMLMKFKECISDCQKAVELDTTSGPKMWARCQKAALQLGDLKSALSFWDLIATHNKGKVTDDQLNERQRLQSGAERLAKITASTPKAEVQDNYKLLMTRFPEVNHFRLMYAESMMSADRFDEVINKLSNGYARTPKGSLLLAKAYYMSGFEEFPRAKSTITEFAEVDPECKALKVKIFSVDEHKQKGNELFAKKHFADSIVCYTSAIELASTNGRVLRVLYCNRAAAYKEVGKFKEGVEDCTKAISFDGRFVKAFARRARCLLGCQDFQCAVSDFKKACELDPNDPELARELRYAQRLADDEIAKEKDLYHVLGVSKNATTSEIRSRFRELSLKYHPDKCMGLPDVQKVDAERKFKLINEAYQTLSNQESRAKYDMADAAAHRRPWAAGGGAGGFGTAADRYANAMPHDIFRNAANPNNRYNYNAGAAGGGVPRSNFNW